MNRIDLIVLAVDLIKNAKDCSCGNIDTVSYYDSQLDENVIEPCQFCETVPDSIYNIERYLTNLLGERTKYWQEYTNGTSSNEVKEIAKKEVKDDDLPF